MVIPTAPKIPRIRELLWGPSCHHFQGHSFSTSRIIMYTSSGYKPCHAVWRRPLEGAGRSIIIDLAESWFGLSTQYVHEEWSKIWFSNFIHDPICYARLANGRHLGPYALTRWFIFHEYQTSNVGRDRMRKRVHQSKWNGWQHHERPKIVPNFQ